MRITRILIAILVLAGTAGTRDIGTLQKELEAIRQDLHTAIRKGDMEAQLKHFSEDALILPNFHPMIRGRAQMRDLMRLDIQNETVWHTYETRCSELWACDGKIFEWGTFSVSQSNKFMRTPIALFGSYLTVWERQGDGRLRMTHTIWNLDHPLR